MRDERIYAKAIRPLPYYNVPGSADESALAAALRREFVPKLRRLLPGHHLTGFRHDFIVDFVKCHKHKYPCFVRADIAKFYPSIRHKDMIVGCQLAYRDLLNLDYVPKSFKSKYLGPLNEWCRQLPMHKGIPIGSALSGILAPVMLIPLWLQIKRRFGVPFLVFMDDILVCTADEHQSAEIYAYIGEWLHSRYELELNVHKTRSGRFGTTSVEFCGWRFAGGYATVSEAKIAAFKERITDFVRNAKHTDVRAFIKRLNRKIDGFGHYYKFGHVANQFRTLDMHIRSEVRKWFADTAGITVHTVKHLSAAGLRRLTDICQKQTRKLKRQTVTSMPVSMQQEKTMSTGVQVRIAETLDKIHGQLTTIVSLQRRQIRMMDELLQFV